MDGLRVSTSKVILPGGTIGILGSGQLGRMLALAARQLGYRVEVYSPDRDTPAGAVADREWVGEYSDLEQVRAFARTVDVITFEFENVPSATTTAAAEFTPVRPDGRVLHITQQRLREKTFLRDRGFPVTPFSRVNSRSELATAASELGVPAVLKTSAFGYDGKGQQKIRAMEDLDSAWAAMKGTEAIYEAFVNFSCEVSVVAARTASGEFQAFPVFQNAHAHHILDVTFAPADISPALADEAVRLARGILDALEVVGLLTVEMFVTGDGRLVVNELAPRTHNSGHLTLDACWTSQFEQQLRAVCGLPLGNPSLKQPGAMANLLGHLWSPKTPDWAAALADPGIKLHLYGKAEARPGRKMGHLNACDATVQRAVERVVDARRRLQPGSPLPS